MINYFNYFCRERFFCKSFFNLLLLSCLSNFMFKLYFFINYQTLLLSFHILKYELLYNYQCIYIALYSVLLFTTFSIFFNIKLLNFSYSCNLNLLRAPSPSPFTIKLRNYSFIRISTTVNQSYLVLTSWFINKYFVPLRPSF